MSAVSPILRRSGSDGYTMLIFWCPGCDGAHGVAVERPAGQKGPTWCWNGDVNKPTFTPSISIKTGRAVDKNFKPEAGDPPEVCHSFVRNGKIEFLNDCTHALAGQIVDLPPRWAGQVET